MKKKYKTPINDKGQAHGYWERYNYNDKLWIRCVYIDDKINGVFEQYWSDGKLRRKIYYL